MMKNPNARKSCILSIEHFGETSVKSISDRGVKESNLIEIVEV
jgi:hypothetical protein